MRKILKIAKVELNVLFYSPIAWLLLVIFMVQCSLTFFGMLQNYGNAFANGYNLGRPLTAELFGGTIGLFTNVQSYLYLYMPILTMGLMSRETSSGSIKLLLSSPVKLSEIILGKYLAMVFYGLLMMGVLMIYSLIGLFGIAHVESGVIFSGLLGIFLLMCAYSAIGLFMSCLTIYQVVAAISTLAVFAALRYVGGLWQQYDFFRDLTYFLSISGRTDKMIMGIIVTRDLFYYVIIIALFLWLCILLLKGQRELKSNTYKTLRYMLFVCGALLIGYVTSRPVLTGYLDATQNKSFTILPASQKVAERFKDGELNITTYDNLLAPGYYQFLPANRNQDFFSIEPFKRFVPGMSIEYKYYYQPPTDTDMAEYRNSPLLRHIKGTNQLARRMAENDDLDFNLFKTPQEVSQHIDLKSFGYLNMRQLEYKGKVTYLNYLSKEFIPMPGEPEWIAALKRLTQPVPHVTYIVGNNERNLTHFKDKGYYTFFLEPLKRISLVNQGFDVDSLNLNDADIPANTSILVIGDPTEPFSAAAQQKLSAYINSGGNLFISTQAGRADAINPLLSKCGVQLKKGQLVNPGVNSSGEKVEGEFTEASGSTDPAFDTLRSKSITMRLPDVGALAYSDSGSFKTTPIVASPATGWLKKAPVNVDAASVGFSSADGDEKGSFPIMLALARSIKNKQQRILVSSDASFISNEGLNKPSIIGETEASHAIFRWLTYGEYPVLIDRPAAQDTTLNIGKENIALLQVICKYIIPGLIALFGIILLFRRRRN